MFHHHLTIFIWLMIWLIEGLRCLKHFVRCMVYGIIWPLCHLCQWMVTLGLSCIAGFCLLDLSSSLLCSQGDKNGYSLYLCMLMLPSVTMEWSFLLKDLDSWQNVCRCTGWRAIWWAPSKWTLLFEFIQGAALLKSLQLLLFYFYYLYKSFGLSIGIMGSWS